MCSFICANSSVLHSVYVLCVLCITRVFIRASREPKQQSVVRLPPSVLQEMGEVSSIQCNCDGARVSLLSRKVGRTYVCMPNPAIVTGLIRVMGGIG